MQIQTFVIGLLMTLKVIEKIITYYNNYNNRWRGWPSDESTYLPPMWHGFAFRTQCHMWIEFVRSLLCHDKFFSGYSGFPLSSNASICFDLISE